MVVYEALALETDVITVDLPETIQYLEEDKAIIVDNNAKGIYNGLYKHRYNQYEIKSFNFEPFRQLLYLRNLKKSLNNSYRHTMIANHQLGII